MVFRHGNREYPYLAAFLAFARGRSLGRVSAEMFSALVLTILSPFLLPELLEARIPGIAYLAILAISWVLALRERSKTPSASEMLRRDATVVAIRMSRRLERSRLHRDLGDPTLTVLDECAKSWSGIHRTLDSASWRAADLPPHYASLRDQILAAADLAMDETLLLFQGLIPAGHSPTPIGAVIEEAVFGASPGPLPPGFDKARETADKLRVLEIEVSRVDRQAKEELGSPVDTGASRAIELCLGELKEIRVAQDELRQNLRGQS